MLDEKLARLSQAITDRTSLSGIYKSEPRDFSPHALGKGRYDEDVVLVYQYGGMSGGKSALGWPAERCWRMFAVEDLHSLKDTDGGWHSHDTYGAALQRLNGVSTAVAADDTGNTEGGQQTAAPDKPAADQA